MDRLEDVCWIHLNNDLNEILINYFILFTTVVEGIYYYLQFVFNLTTRLNFITFVIIILNFYYFVLDYHLNFICLLFHDHYYLFQYFEYF